MFSVKTPTALIGYIVDAFFLLDILINFLTTYPESETEEIVKNHRRIAIHYLKTWFAVDFIAVIPFDWFVDSVRPDSEDVSGFLNTCTFAFSTLLYILFNIYFAPGLKKVCFRGGASCQNVGWTGERSELNLGVWGRVPGKIFGDHAL